MTRKLVNALLPVVYLTGYLVYEVNIQRPFLPCKYKAAFMLWGIIRLQTMLNACFPQETKHDVVVGIARSK
jgi:hypothetical protein